MTTATTVSTAELDVAVKTAQAFLAEYEAFSNKTTKASSKRLRAHLNDLKKLVTPAKNVLLAIDETLGKDKS